MSVVTLSDASQPVIVVYAVVGHVVVVALAPVLTMHETEDTTAVAVLQPIVVSDVIEFVTLQPLTVLVVLLQLWLKVALLPAPPV